MLERELKNMVIHSNLTAFFIIYLSHEKVCSCKFSLFIIYHIKNINKYNLWRCSCQDAQAAIQVIHAKTIDRQLKRLECEKIARLSGFQKRIPKKINADDFLKSLCAAGANRKISFNILAMILGIVSGCQVSKQAVAKRVNESCVDFLQQSVCSAINTLSGIKSSRRKSIFTAFNRTLIQDSTSFPLPDHFADSFPGGKNQFHLKKASMKIQAIYELLSERIIDFSLSGFTRNDQAASPDILDIAQKGDLVLRDLGYFVSSVFNRMNNLGIYFLSRYRKETAIMDPITGRRINLLAELKANSTIDRDVLLGQKERVPVRLVAIPVPDAVANERRRKAKNNRDKRCRPSKKCLQLMGWQIFVTNVELSKWSTQDVAEVYRIRWRIEIIFKAWKSHFNLTETPDGLESLILICFLGKLLYICFFHAFFDQINRCMKSNDQGLSILKVAAFSSLYLSIFHLAKNSSVLHEIIRAHCFYEKRKDRKNFYELQAALS